MKLTEVFAQKTYRARRIYPVDAKWAEDQIKKHVNTKGFHSWEHDNLSFRRWKALVDFAQKHQDEYYWGEDKVHLTIGKEPEMQEVDLDHERLWGYEE